MTNKPATPFTGIWHEITIKQVKHDLAYVAFKDNEFTLPIEWIKHQIKPGDRLYIQILDEEQKNQKHEVLAKNILNIILGNK